MAYLNLAMVNTHGVKIYRANGSTKELAIKKLAALDVSMSTPEFSTGSFVLGKKSNACMQFGIDDFVWFDETEAQASGLCL